MATFYMKRNDTRPKLDVSLKDSDDEYLDLTVSGVSVNFTMKESDGSTIIVDSQACTIVNGLTGSVRYSWAAADTATAGAYLAEFEVVYANGDKLTVPTTNPLAVVILEDYNAV